MKKNSSKKLPCLGLLAVLIMLQTAVYATYTPTYLPESSFWQGSRFYNQNGVDAYVEYAVYDSTSNEYHNFMDGAIDGFVHPGSGQYIYAYEVVNLDSSNSLLPIATFELLGGSPSLASGIGSARDTSGVDIVPTTDGTSFVWKFENGAFVANNHSAYMVFSSDKGPVAGVFRLTTLTEGGDEPPVNDDTDPKTPEPATLALLAGGAIMLLRKRIRN